MHGMAGIASIITATFMQRKGRRTAFIVGCICVTLGWLIAYIATSVTVILISELVHGFGTNSLFIISLLSMSEMASPRFRNVSVQSYGIVQALGLATSGILSTFLGWKHVCIVMIVPIIIAFFLSMFWPESPPWLACKGRFDECYEAFGQLRKIDATSKIELEELIAAQKENLFRDKSEKNTASCALCWSTLKRRDFYLPAIHVFVLLSMTYWGGSGVVVINSFDLIQKTTSNARAPYWGGVVLNAVLFIGMFLSSIINKRFKTKTVLLTSAICTSSCLFGVFLVTLLQSSNIISKESLACMYFFIGFVAFDSLGIIPMVFTIVSEIMPVKHRGLGGAVYVIFNSFLCATALKTAPYLFSYINIWGTFLLYTFNVITCGLLIWRFVPETKNKTLQQIEDFYMFGKFGKNRVQESKPCIDDC